jgi:DNA-binding GntR family transcriptional regulator
VKGITEAQLKTADDLLNQMDDADDVTEWAILNAAFHGLLAEASRMPILRSHLVKLRNLSTLYIASQIHRHPDRVVQANAEHRAILEACKARDVRRAQEVEVAHLEHTLAIGAESLGRRPRRASRSRGAR